MKYSLCIPTMNRFESFLKSNLTSYLNNPLIDEIIITDENGEDIKKIQLEFNSEKLLLFTNDKQLGPFLNKLKAMKLAKNEWIAIIDSDNFADNEYFIKGKEFILFNKIERESILAPSFAMPNFNYRIFNNVVATKLNMKDLINKNKNLFSTLMNTGNYIINKYLIDNINIENELGIIPETSACDVIFFNTLLLEQFSNLKIYIVEDLHYSHVVHDGSIYIQTNQIYSNMNFKIHQRFYRLINI